MSQCHDIYDESAPIPKIRANRAPFEGAQCHDSPDREGSSARSPTVQDGCWFFDNHCNGAQVMRAVGRIDWATKTKFQEVLDREGKHDLVVDLSAASMDTAGTMVLLTWVQQACKRHQRVVVVSYNAVQRGLLFFVGLDRVVPIVSSQREALAWFTRHPVTQALPERPHQSAASQKGRYWLGAQWRVP